MTNVGDLSKTYHDKVLKRTTLTQLLSLIITSRRDMSISLVYIDQNIIGLQLQGHMKLDKREDLNWVYSKEHFKEMRRADDPEKYLDVLNKINTKMIDLTCDENLKIADEAKLIDHGSRCEHYQDYIEATGGEELDETLFDPFQVWVNGGGNEELLKELPENL